MRDELPCPQPEKLRQQGCSYMPKKKPNRKKPTPKGSSNKASIKKKKHLAKRKTSKKRSNLGHWKQIPGTFTYEFVHPNHSKWVCCAKHDMTEEDLFTQYLLHNTFDMADPLKPGEIKIFNAVPDPIKTFKAMFRNPPKGWVQYVRRFLLRYRLEQRQRAQKALKADVKRRIKGNKNSKIVRLNGICVNCHGRHWVCEDHNTLPWEMLDDTGCPCCAPGMACPDCNPDSTLGIGSGYSPLRKEFLKKLTSPFGKSFATATNLPFDLE